MAIIKNINARQILDSRGNPTIEVDVFLDNNICGRGAVPSGASTGTFEALELRDENQAYLGKGVSNAINNINNIISKHVCGVDFTSVESLDKLLIELDGTDNKSFLGANAILGVSIAFAYALANYHNMPLYKLLLKNEPVLPVPMMNIINGGSHADNNIDIQEFMIFPLGAESFSQSLQMGVEVFHYLKDILKTNNFQTAVGDEGGFAPNLNSNEHAIEIILEAIEKSGYRVGEDIYIALDVAASELYDSKEGLYYLKSENKRFDSSGMIDYYDNLCQKFPIVSIEDGLDEEDWKGWESLYAQLGERIQLVGDDLTVTNPIRFKRAINSQAINSILIKLNQIGTITETIDTINMAHESNMGAIISHRSGETEDTTIADLAVAMGMGQIKTGSVSRSDRTAKYNQLLRIEEELQSSDNCVLFGNINFLGHNLS